MKSHSLKERGIEKPQGSRAKKASRLNGAAKPFKAAKPAKLRLTLEQRKQVISEWLELVAWAEAITSPAFANLTMTHLQLIVAKVDIPPPKGSPTDVAIDRFASEMAKMMIAVLTEVLTESDDVVRKRVMGGTVLQALGPRPDPKSYPSLKRQHDWKPLQEKHVYEMESEEEFQAWLAERQAREGAAT